MRQIHAESTAVIDARPEEVYAIVADYRHSHALILPKENFRDLQVEAGGQGAGTIITFRSGALGVMRAYRTTISEPDPGRVLVEADLQSTLVTTFTFTPLNNGQQVRVQIATDMDASPGIQGAVEQRMMPLVLRGIYKKELKLLAEVAEHQKARNGNL